MYIIWVYIIDWLHVDYTQIIQVAMVGGYWYKYVYNVYIYFMNNVSTLPYITHETIYKHSMFMQFAYTNIYEIYEVCK